MRLRSRQDPSVRWARREGKVYGMTQQGQEPVRATLLDYLQLFRFANVFTAMADVTMGFLFVHGSLAPMGTFVCLLFASSMLYTAGMALNDVYDVETDARERPDRPIPSGRISLSRAQSLGYSLLLCGVGLGWLAAFVEPVDDAALWRAGAVASLLGLCVVLYDAVLKTTLAGPVVMGACRFLNVLVGMSIAVPFSAGWNLAGYGIHHLIPAGGIGVYVIGITWFARTEAKESNRLQLSLATAVMMGGIAILCLLHRNLPFLPNVEDELWWVLLLAALAFTILRRCGSAISDPTPWKVQMAVKHSILSIIVLDAAVTLEVCHWYHAMGILVLLIPALVLGKWMYST